MYKGMTLTEMVKDKSVNFEYYRKGELWYRTQDGFLFPVPISDTGDGTFLSSDKATLFMRYIRKHLAVIAEEQKMKNVKINNFLVNSEETGRFIVKSLKSGKTYFVEAIGNPKTDWGSVDPSGKKVNVKKGWQKHQGSVGKEDSLITKENGFEKIHTLSPGMSPLAYIEKLDQEYLQSVS